LSEPRSIAKKREEKKEHLEKPYLNCIKKKEKEKEKEKRKRKKKRDKGEKGEKEGEV